MSPPAGGTNGCRIENLAEVASGATQAGYIFKKLLVVSYHALPKKSKQKPAPPPVGGWCGLIHDYSRFNSRVIRDYFTST